MLCVTDVVVSKALRTLLLLFLLGNSTFQVRRKEQGGFNALKRGLELIRNYFRHPRMISQSTTKKNYFWQQVWRKERRGTKKGGCMGESIKYYPSYQTMTGRVTKQNDTHSSERVCVCVGVKNDSIRELPPPPPFRHTDETAQWRS
jgi:hypothetical protein